MLLLGGCVANGDFDRVRPLLVSDEMHDWIGRDHRGNVRAQDFAAPMTDDEGLLRDLAYPLIEPPFDRNRWYSVIGEYERRSGLVEPSRGTTAPPSAWAARGSKMTKVLIGSWRSR